MADPDPGVMRWVVRLGVVAFVLIFGYVTRSRAVKRKVSKASRPSAAAASGKVVLKPARFRTLVVENLRASAIGVAVEEKGDLRISVRYPRGKEAAIDLQPLYDGYLKAPASLDDVLEGVRAAARAGSLGA